MEHTATPLNDVIADLRPAESAFGEDPGEAGDVRRRVDHELNAGYELLLDQRDGDATDPARRAAEHVDEAIATLEHLRRRLARIAG